MARNLVYKKKLNCGYFKNKSPVSSFPKHDVQLFDVDGIKSNTSFDHEVLKEFKLDIQNIFQGKIKLFFWQKVNVNNPPDWFFHNYKSCKSHWSEIKLNSVVGEDIKLTWDFSRFHWFQQLACEYKAHANNEALELLNQWFLAWCKNNPANVGVNWFCGQECSIRIIHILNATKIIPDVQYKKELLIELVEIYAKRIRLSIGYAVSQDNNHGVTEAAALFICGAWLVKYSQKNSFSSLQLMNLGRKILENRVSKLIMGDGGFSMYSTNYHRAVLNTLSIVEMWRAELGQAKFSPKYLQQCQSAIRWLLLLVDKEDGDTINLGANDGSNPFIVQSSDYRDYRPAIQFASVIFNQKKAYDSSAIIDEPLLWLGLNEDLPVTENSYNSQVLKDSGMVVLFGHDVEMPDTKAFIVYPHYLFRPGQSDALHVDLWHKGKNILRDGGSYSYNGTLDEDLYFSSLQAHNTIQADSIEPMPKISSFLRSNWSEIKRLSNIEKNKNTLSWQGEYAIKLGLNHKRKVSLSNNSCLVYDDVIGANVSIVLRWRLCPETWILQGNVLSCSGVLIEVSSNKLMEITLKKGYESRYYNQYEEVPILEVSISSTSALITTTICFNE